MNLLLLHGLGADGGVWDSLASAARHRGHLVVAPDLPGHGRSPLRPPASFGGMAAAAAEAVAVDGRLTVIGHSLGGIVGLALGSGWFGLAVERVVALGCKVEWSDDDLAGARRLADRGVREFDEEADARTWGLRLAGLADLVPADGAWAAGAVVEVDGRWRARWDPATALVGRPDTAGLLAACRADVVLARGEHDPLVTADQLRALRHDAVELPGLGHNAHVEDADAVLTLASHAPR